LGAALLSEVEGVIQGHRDGHGFLQRDDGETPIYLSPQEMRAVMHRDRVRVRIVRYDRKGRAEGRVLEILQRPRAPIRSASSSPTRREARSIRSRSITPRASTSTRPRGSGSSTSTAS